MNTGRTLGNIFEVVALVMKKPRTVTEISEVTGRDRTVIRQYLVAAEGEGLVAKSYPKKPIGTPGITPAVWTWQAA